MECGVTSTYTYRADGMRLTKSRNGVTTEYLYDGQQPLIELRSDDVRTDYVLGFNGMPLARTVTQNETSATDYYLYDGLGCVMALGNASFSITQTLEYDVWGSQRAGQGSSTNGLKYVGSLGQRRRQIRISSRECTPMNGNGGSVRYVFCHPFAFIRG